MLERVSNPYLKFIFKTNGLGRAIHRFAIKHSINSRPSSYPYISGDSLRDIADHVYEDQTKFNPDQTIQKRYFSPDEVKKGDVVFVDARSAGYFFENVHDKIDKDYVLITHNADTTIDERYIKFIDAKTTRWFAQNVAIKHPKIIPIPIGIENLYYYNHGVTGYFDCFRAKIDKIEKKNRILYGFSIINNVKERRQVYDYLQATETADKIAKKLNSKMYLDLLSGYKFIASPSGNGLDCHRTWEAMYLGAIPIVSRSVAMEYFYDLGLPLWIIDDWNELQQYNERFLENKYVELQDRFKSKALFMDYWIKQIKKV